MRIARFWQRCSTMILALVIGCWASDAAAALRIEVVAGPSPARPSELLDVEISVTNDGGSNRENVSVFISFAAGLQGMSQGYAGATGCSNGFCDPGETAQVLIPVIPAGRGVSISIPPRIAAAATNGTVIPFNVEVWDDGSQEDNATTSVVVGSARQVELALVEDRDPVAPGQLINYQLTFGVVPSSPGSPNATLTLPLPANTTFVSASDGGSFNGSAIQWGLGNVGPGAGGNRWATVQVNPGATLGSIIQAVATYQDAAGPSNVVTFESGLRVQNQPPLELAVCATPDPARPGEVMEVEVTVTNAGPFDRNGVTIAVDFPDHIVGLFEGWFTATGCSNGICDPQERAFIDVGTLKPGQGKTYTLPMIVAAGVPDGTVVTIDADVNDAVGDLRRASRNFTVRNSRNLELAIEENRDPAVVNGTITYTLTYGVLSPSPAAANARLTLSVPPGTTYLSSSEGGALVGNEVRWSLGGLSPGQYGERSVTVQINPAVAAGGMLLARGWIEDLAAPANRTCHETCTRVEPAHPLQLTITASPDPARPGETMDAEITVTNSGTFDLTGVEVALEFPDQVEGLFEGWFSGVGCSNAICNAQERAFIDVGTLEPGRGVAYSFPMRVAAGVPDGTVITMQARASDDQGDQRLNATSFAVNNARRLQLAMSENRAPASPGSMLTYSLTYGVPLTSSGSPNATLEFPIPGGTTFVSASDGGVHAGGLVIWSLGNINRGASGERTVTVQVSPGVTPGSILEAVAVARDVASPSNVSRTETDTRVLAENPLELTIIASPDPARPDETLDVEVTVTNTGTFDRNDVMIVIEFPDNLIGLFEGWFSGTGCSNAICNAQERSFISVGTLGPGQARTFTLPARVAPGVVDGTVISLEANVSDSQGDRRECATSIAVQAVRPLDLAMVESAEPVAPGSTLTYTITYGAYSGGGGAAGGQLRFVLPAGTTFNSATGGGSHAGGIVTWGTGNVNPGAGGSRSVTVNVPPGTPTGTQLTAMVRFTDASGREVRFGETTRVQAASTLALSLAGGPNPALPSDTLNLVWSVTNNGALAANSVNLVIEFPDDLNGLFEGTFNGVGCSNAICNAQEKSTVALGTINPGQTVNVTMQPVVTVGTTFGTVINFDAHATDITGAQASGGKAIMVGEHFSTGFVPGDITGDGEVDVNDLLAVINGWGACPNPCPPTCLPDIAPAGGNCAVDVKDLLAVINNWG